MIELFKSIWTEYDNSTTLKALLTGGFHYGKSPQSGALPYATYFGMETLNEDTFGVEISDIPIQMNIYSDINPDATECFAILAACKALYRNTVLTVSGAWDVTLTKEMEIPPKNLDGIKWMAVISFNGLLQEK